MLVNGRWMWRWRVVEVDSEVSVLDQKMREAGNGNAEEDRGYLCARDTQKGSTREKGGVKAQVTLSRNDSDM